LPGRSFAAGLHRHKQNSAKARFDRWPALSPAVAPNKSNPALRMGSSLRSAIKS
jgi:hypothetical protein